MSKLFYDYLIELPEIDLAIKEEKLESEEREELQKLVDEMIHHRVLVCILDHLPREHHEEFLERFHAAPHDETLIIFLEEKTPAEISIEEKIREEIQKLKQKLLDNING